MNWPDERYVRLYTRKTAEWGALCWQAKALHALLLMECDRAGVIAVPHGPRRVKMLAGLVGLPLEVVEAGIRDLLEDGRVVETAAGYVWPNYIEAQETPASGAQRVREHRARKRELHRQHALQTPVSSSSRNEPLQAVTEVAENVTPYHAVPCRASSSTTTSTAAPANKTESQENEVPLQTPAMPPLRVVQALTLPAPVLSPHDALAARINNQRQDTGLLPEPLHRYGRELDEAREAYGEEALLRFHRHYLATQSVVLDGEVRPLANLKPSWPWDCFKRNPDKYASGPIDAEAELPRRRRKASGARDFGVAVSHPPEGTVDCEY